MDDWLFFLDCVPWFYVRDDVPLKVGKSARGFPLSAEVKEVFPTLSHLCLVADVTPISIGKTKYQLFAWDNVLGSRSGWLAFSRPIKIQREVCPSHRLLLSSFGGISERFNEPPTWLMNLNTALGPDGPIDATFISNYGGFEVDQRIPIVPADFYGIAEEANGNVTLCHRKSEEILLFAHDHNFKYVTPLDGCPDYTLYRVAGAPDFRSWVESVAHQWLDQIAI